MVSPFKSLTHKIIFYVIRFLDECINGNSFVDLTQEDMIAMNIKMGPAKELLKIINSLKKTVSFKPLLL